VTEGPSNTAFLLIDRRPDNGGWILEQRASIPDQPVGAYLSAHAVWLYRSSEIDCFVFNLLRTIDEGRSADTKQFSDAIT
jgi:hypothetical protein